MTTFIYRRNVNFFAAIDMPLSPNQKIAAAFAAPVIPFIVFAATIRHNFTISMVAFGIFLLTIVIGIGWCLCSMPDHEYPVRQHVAITSALGSQARQNQTSKEIVVRVVQIPVAE